jgi:hypothetical protein
VIVAVDGWRRSCAARAVKSAAHRTRWTFPQVSRAMSASFQPRVAGGVAEFLRVGGSGVVRAGQADALRARDRAHVVEVVGDVAHGRAGLLGGQRHHAQAPGRAELGEQVVGEVGRVGAQRAGGGPAAQRGRLGDGEGAAGGLLAGAGEVGDHAEPVHLADGLLAEPGEPLLARPGDAAEREDAQAEEVQGAQYGEGVAEGGGSGGAEQHGGASAVAGVGDIPGAVRQAQALGVGAGDGLHEVELLDGGRDGAVAAAAVGQVQRPEQGTDVAAPKPGDVGVDAALAEFQVVPVQVAQRPRQSAVAVGDGVGGEQGAGAPQGGLAVLVVSVGGRRGGFGRVRLGGERLRELTELAGGVQVVLEICHGGLRTS